MSVISNDRYTFNYITITISCTALFRRELVTSYPFYYYLYRELFELLGPVNNFMTRTKFVKFERPIMTQILRLPNVLRTEPSGGARTLRTN